MNAINVVNVSMSALPGIIQYQPESDRCYQLLPDGFWMNQDAS
jgi:hypothetical protein